MTTKRQATVATFDHVMDDVLEQDDDSPLKKALIKEGFVSMASIQMMDTDTIKALTYDKSTTEKDVDVPLFYKSLLIAIIEYIVHRETTGNPIKDAWDKVTKDDFDNFRTSVDFITRRWRTTPMNASRTSTGTSSSHLRHETIEEFITNWQN